MIVPGQSGESELFARITSNDPDELMPPKKSGRSMTPAQIDILNAPGLIQGRPGASTGRSSQ